MSNNVIIRAFGEEPVVLCALARDRRLIYVANPDSLGRVEAGLTEPVGVPIEDAFRFESDLYQKLRKRWESGDRKVWSETSLISVR